MKKIFLLIAICAGLMVGCAKSDGNDHQSAHEAVASIPKA